ncbi:phospholipase D family protein [Bermanella marisrubri]|uniref:PLD phosphodiesterase domain-containing protein n=1 Tax=Bermanella marisrubri TaxID=207949 RepID=Q1N480_9GAMM|nr:phospholipase D family protein [Bermanella marisrubri]EAT12985.1 putative protein with phospholipase D/nuclease domain [Oceanobacter sp. RED65] [Bermanella marisrubri]QIZ82888.1 phospholipase D family protein [Bermanella marisrubri]
MNPIEHALQSVQQQGGDLSAFRLLGEGPDALAARLFLIEHAQTSLDLQYYIFRHDVAGKVICQKLVEAADRGVAVRLLVDDYGQLDDDALLSLQAHQNIEIRFFNPVRWRRLRYLEMLARFSKQSRRMHNKLFIADGCAAVVGGRNIADSYYFNNGEERFADLDALAMGLVCVELNNVFEEYWQHRLSHSVEEILGNTKKRWLNNIRDDLNIFMQAKVTRPYLQQVIESKLHKDAHNHDWQWHYAKADVLCDHPDKILRFKRKKRLGVAAELWKYLDEVSQSALLITPYFVPGGRLIRKMRYWKRQNYDVIVLTNSLSANDVPIVHSGYARYRKRLLRAQVQLWELKDAVPDIKLLRSKRKKIGQTRASLHAKTLVLDKQRLFVGSLNLDHRSININTEVGLLIHSEALSNRVTQIVSEQLPELAWHLGLNHDEELIWYDVSTGKDKIIATKQDPNASLWARIRVKVYSWLPIESLL